MEKSPISNKKASNKRKPGLFFKPQRLQFKKKLYSTQTAIVSVSLYVKSEMFRLIFSRQEMDYML